VQNSTVKYGNVFTEIAVGLSQKAIEGRTYYFKHPTQAEHFEIYGKYYLIFEDAKKRGLLSEEEKIEDALKNGWWTKQKEVRFNQLNDNIKNLKITRNNLLLPSQKQQIDKEIQRNIYILSTFEKERNEIIGYTAEKYANERLYDEMLLSLTYKNSNLTERLFTDSQEYYYLSDSIVESIREGFFSSMAILSPDSIKKVAACTFFQNMLYVTSECDVMSFWGKSATQCTKYQIDLLINGKVFKNAIKNEMQQGGSISDDVLSDPEKFVLWYDSQTNNATTNSTTSSNFSGSNNAVSSFVGATKEDLKQMGVKIEKIKGKSLLQLAEEKGGVLQKHEYLNAREGS